MREQPKPYEIYRHFKGNLYQILAIAKDSEDGSLKVVYQALYGTFEVYVRDLSMFLSPVDKKMYPEAAQEYRFELVDMKKVNTDRKEPEPEMSADTDAKSEVFVETVEPEADPGLSENEADVEKLLDPMLLQFLDSDTYEEKLHILSALHPRITQDMLNTIAAALDIEVAEGELEERYEQVKSCLLTFEKYECNRLR